VNKRSMSMSFAATLGLGLCALASWTAPQAVRQEQRADMKTRLKACFDASDAKEQLASLSASMWLGEEVVLSGWSAGESGKSREGADFARPAPWALEAFAAVALLRLVDSDKLEFNDLVSEHLPELKFGGQRVTVEQVLAHTSGAPSFVDFVATAKEPQTAESVLAWLGERPLDAAPGSCFVYSESNALIAVALATKLTEKPIQKALHEWVFEPAGMAGTLLALGDVKVRPKSAAFYAGGAPADAVAVADLIGVTGITTTLDDLAKLLRSLNGELLSGDTRRTLLAADRLATGVETPYSWGFARSSVDRKPCFALVGVASEQALHVAWHPKSELVIALAGRPTNAGLAPLADELASVVFEIPEREILDLPLTSEQRAIYAGVYYMGCTRATIETRDEQLFFQSPYDGPFRLRYQGEHLFIAAEDDEVRFEFTVDSGVAQQFVLIQHGARSGAVRMK